MIEDLTADIDRLVAAGSHVVSDGESVLALRRQLARLDAVVARAEAAFEAGGEWAQDGVRGAAQWLAWKAREPRGVINQSLKYGRSLRTMPQAEAAWLAGDITGAHVDVLSHAKNPTTEKAFGRDEAKLLAEATTKQFRAFARAVTYWFQHHDPDGDERTARKQIDGRHFHFSLSFQNNYFANGVFDPVGGAAIAEELRRLEDELFLADWEEAKRRVGRPPTVLELQRTQPQRRADALVEMATRSRTVPAGGKRPAPLFTVFLNYEALAGRICQLADGTPVPPASLDRWMQDALFERVVFETPSRVIDVSEQRRLFGGALRRAVEVVHRECYNDACELPVDFCQADHIVPYGAGGPTTQDNGRLACGFHNRLRNQRPADDDEVHDDSDAEPP